MVVRLVGSAVAFRGAYVLSAASKSAYAEQNRIECLNVQYEQGNHAQGIEDRMAAGHVVQDVVGRAVPLHEEHIIVIGGDVGEIGGHAEPTQYSEGDGHILSLHADKPRKPDVQCRESRNGMGDSRHHVIK